MKQKITLQEYVLIFLNGCANINLKMALFLGNRPEQKIGKTVIN